MKLSYLLSFMWMWIRLTTDVTSAMLDAQDANRGGNTLKTENLMYFVPFVHVSNK